MSLVLMDVCNNSYNNDSLTVPMYEMKYNWQNCKPGVVSSNILKS